MNEFDPEADRKEELLMDAVSGELVPCEHPPEKLSMIGEDMRDDQIIHHYECQCGRRVDEVFSLHETREVS